MDQAKVIQSSTFCSAPWTSLNIDQTGRVFPCMHSGYELGNIKEQAIQEVLVGKNMQNLRNAIQQGRWHSACTWCKQLEETTGVSGRTVRHVSNDTLDAIKKDYINFFQLEHIVVNWSNLCNLTCVYCNPDTSTAWQSIRSIPINHVKNEHRDLIALAKEHGQHVQGLTLGGGEPLLQKGLIEFLQCLDPNQVSVLVTTNLSVDIVTNPIYRELSTWPKVDWQISFDNANKEKFEYVRAGANWDQFVKNISVMKQQNQKVIAHPAYSVYCAFDLVEYYDFCNDNDLDIFWCELTHPWDLDIRRYPINFRQEAVNEINLVVSKYSNRTNMAIETLNRYRETLLDPSYLQNYEYQVNPIAFHQAVEQELPVKRGFLDLWPTFRNIHMNPPHHFGKDYANTTQEWLPTDTKENYEKLIQDPEHLRYFTSLGWDQPGAITYKFNSYGFRCDEFNGGPYMLALGCSYTVGIGLPIESTWAHQTAAALGLKCANLAWGGYSADTCYRLAEYWVQELCPDYVCMLVPPKHRVELLMDDNTFPVEIFLPQSQSSWFNENDEYLKHWFLNDKNAEINQRKNLRAVKQLCAELNIPCTIINAEEHMWWSREEIGYARDYMHGGPKIHNILAEKFIDGYKK